MGDPGPLATPMVKTVTNAQPSNVYKEKRSKASIADAKNKDFLKFCIEDHIPSNHRDFYENLYHQSLIKDCLTTPDIEDNENHGDKEQKVQMLLYNAENKTVCCKESSVTTLWLLWFLSFFRGKRLYLPLRRNRSPISNNSIMHWYFMVNHKLLLRNQVWKLIACISFLFSNIKTCFSQLHVFSLTTFLHYHSGTTAAILRNKKLKSKQTNHFRIWLIDNWQNCIHNLKTCVFLFFEV